MIYFRFDLNVGLYLIINKLYNDLITFLIIGKKFVFLLRELLDSL